MTGNLSLRNRQRTCRVDLRLLRQIATYLLQEHFQPGEIELGLHLVGAGQMTVLNERFLRHAGSTDVITFDYQEPSRPMFLSGDIFVCLEEAKRQAVRYRTGWTLELVRYVIHGLLHLQGYDDLKQPARRKMKEEEDRLLRAVKARFKIQRLNKARDRARPRL